MSKPLRVLQISGNYPPLICGIGDYTHELSSALRQQGVAVKNWSRANADYSSDGWSFTKVINSARKIDFNQFDLIHLQYEPFSFSQSYLLPFIQKRRPLVVTFHEIFQRNFLQKFRDTKLASNAAALIVNDAGSELRLQQKLNADKSKIFKIGVGSNIPFVERQHRSENEFTIGYFGFLNAVKRVDLLIEALAILRSRSQKNIKLRLIGDFQNATSEKEFLESIIQKRGLKNRIEWRVGLSSLEVALSISDCDLIVLPFVDGATPRRGSFQACLTLGKAVVTTKSELPDEELGLGENTILLSRLDADEIAQKIELAVQSPELIRRLENNSRKLSQKYSWTSIAERHVAIYRSILE